MTGARKLSRWSMETRVVAVLAVLIVAAMALWPARTHAKQMIQQPSTPLSRQSNQAPLGSESNPLGEVPSANPGRISREQEKAQTTERYQHMVKDADRLLQLATQLKGDVDKSTKNELPVGAFQKADEIERLAHDVKQRIRN